MVGHVGILGVGEPVEIGPQERQILNRDGLDGVVDALRIFAGQRLPEPRQRLPFAQARQGGAGGLADIRIGIAASVLER